MTNKKVIVTGVTGQDGSYMCEYLLQNTNYNILGGVRRTSQPIFKNLQESLKNSRFKIVPFELTDSHSITTLVKNEKPDYIINFGASSFVADSWNQPSFTMEANANSLIHILEAVKNYQPNCRVYSSGSSEQWGDVKYSPQDEKHPMSPRSIYGVSKCAASLICKIYRESYGLYVVHGILTNHESPRRQSHFVSKKITENVCRISRSIKNSQSFEPLSIGNIYAKRDWSHSKDFVDGIWKMINQEQFDTSLKSQFLDFSSKNNNEKDLTKWLSKNIKEYVLASNETHTVKELIQIAFNKVGIYGNWIGSGLNEKYTDNNSGKLLVSINEKFYRPADVELLHGDSTLARTNLNWLPKYSFDQLIDEMISNDQLFY